MSGPFAEFGSIAACYAALFSEARRLYVSPDIATSAESNPYMRNLYADLSGCAIGAPVSLASAYPVAPLVGRARGERSLWHQHWLQCSSPRTLARAGYRLAAAAVYRALGGDVLWTVHNLEPHVRRYRWANLLLTRGMRAVATKLHVHTESAAREVAARWGVAPERIVVVPHPAYAVEHVPRDTARARLAEHYGVRLGSARVVLVFGMIARYKQLLECIDAFADCDPEAVQLVIAGPVRNNEADYERELRARLERAPVALCAGFVPEEQVAWFFGAADVVLFNYRQILTSGAIQLARDYGRAVWIPDHPSLDDVQGDDVVRFADQAALRSLVRAYAERV